NDQLLLLFLSNQFLEVVQTPEKLWQEPGGSVTMVCKFNSSSKDLRIEWNKHWPEGSLTVLTAKNKMSKAFQTYQNRTQHNFNSTFASLTISDVNPHDSGLYVCEVFIEIPSLHRDSGNGTSLQVYGTCCSAKLLALYQMQGLLLLLSKRCIQQCSAHPAPPLPQYSTVSLICELKGSM
uniref:Ig-like domain-containing protein n=1 Tax=Callorhinchus milii TaxID=7868 RepID=A0A4W3JXX6_CALMI